MLLRNRIVDIMGVDVGGIIGGAYGTLYKNKAFLVLAIIGAIISIAISAFSSSMIPASSLGIAAAYSPAQTLSLLETEIPLLIVTILVGVFITGMLLSAAGQGSGASIVESLRTAASRYLTLLAASILVTIIVGLASTPAIIGVVVGLVASLATFSSSLVGVSSGGLAGVSLLASIIGLVLLIIPLYIGLRLITTLPAVVVGRKGVFDSLKQSWSGTKGSLWGIFAIALVLAIVGIVLELIFSLVNVYVGAFVGELLFSFPILVATVLIYQQLQGGRSKA